METKHTKGPWYYDGELIRANADKDEVTIAIVRGWSKEWRNEEYANGKLIAAAPELLEALEVLTEEIAILELNMSEDYKEGEFSPVSVAANEARAAIAKATGA